jgi:putative colanic acid biosynthesis acetyltransferase WcaF
MKQIEYHAAKQQHWRGATDPYLRPAFPLRDRIRRTIWSFWWFLFFRHSPRPLHLWRAWILRLFGAKLGAQCHFYPSARIWAPWNLVCDDKVTAADGVEIYNPARVCIGTHAILSQNSYLCGASHDYDDPDFPLIAYRMSIGAYAWICARAAVGPGVNIGEGAVLALGSIASSDLDPWYVYAGSPAQKIKKRHHSQEAQEIASNDQFSVDFTN